MYRGVARSSARTVRHARYASTSVTAGADDPPPPKPSRVNARRKFTPDSVGKADIENWTRFVEDVVSKSQSPVKGQWKHMFTRRGEERNLKQKVKEGGRKSARMVDPLDVAPTFARAPKQLETPVASMSKQAFDSPGLVEQVEQEEETRIAPEAPLGSFVEMRRNDSVEIGVVVGSGFRDRQWKISVLTKEGESWIVMKNDCFFSIPSICSADLATRCGLEFPPANDSELHARVEVLKRLRNIQRDVENAMVGISERLPSVYEVVRAKDPKEWSEITLSEIANIFYKNPTAIDLYATHKVLMGATTRFVASPTYISDQSFGVRPLEGVEDLSQVQDWVRDRSLVVFEFVEKAKQITRRQKQLAQETIGDAPGSQPAKHQWTTAEKTIIRFLKASLRHSRYIQPDPYIVTLGSLLRRIYGTEWFEHVDDYVHKLLINIGELAPWQDLNILERSNKFDLETRPAILAEREQNLLRALEKSKDPNPIHPDDFHPTDPLASTRHDWGDMPVYVVDDLGAEELDDGVSVERIPSEPENTWLHIHIADPTSLIPRTNFISERAARQHETWYMVPKSFPLIPKCITHHPTRGLSLGVRSKNGIPDNVITFSVKVNTQGDILDYSVRAGLARNVKVVDYDSVDAALGFVRSEARYPFGNAPPTRSPQPLEPRAIEDMTLLSKLAKTLEKRLLDMSWFSFDRPKSLVQRVDEFPSNLGTDTQLYHGFPNLRYSVECVSQISGSRVMIAETMKLASRAASMFFMDKNVPGLRRIANPMVPSSEEAIDRILKKRNERGFVDEAEVLKDIIYSPSAQYSLLPGMHWGLGVPEGQGYVRVTSPLRRYGDLVAHWQIQQVLLQEKEGRAVKGAFDLEWMENFVGTMTVNDHSIKMIRRRHARFWSLLYIKRWQEMFADGKNRHLWPKDLNGDPIKDPLEDLQGHYITTPMANLLTTESQASVEVPVLGLREILRGIAKIEEGSVNIGHVVPLKIREIRLGVKPLMVLERDRFRTL